MHFSYNVGSAQGGDLILLLLFQTAVRKPAVKRMKPPAGKTSTDESLEHEEPTHTRTIGTQTPEDEKTPPGTATTTDEKK